MQKNTTKIVAEFFNKLYGMGSLHDLSLDSSPYYYVFETLNTHD